MPSSVHLKVIMRCHDYTDNTVLTCSLQLLKMNKVNQLVGIGWQQSKSTINFPGFVFGLVCLGQVGIDMTKAN